MQRSFSIVEDDDDEDFLEGPTRTNLSTKSALADNNKDLIDTDSEENPDSPIRNNLENVMIKNEQREEITSQLRSLTRQTNTSSTGPSRKQTAVIKNRSPIKHKLKLGSSDSELDSDNENDKNKTTSVPGEYDPSVYENLEVDEEIKDIFQYITKYIPQNLNLDYKFKPFVPEFLPAVGDIDAFLKVIPPEATLSGDPFDPDNLQLGLKVLDEPAANQSDPALLHLQLRATSVKATHSNSNVIVKKVDNVDKGAKTIEKWIKDISDLHKSKSSPVVRYSEPMPDLDDLMQEWPEEMENHIKENGFPLPGSETSVSDYAETVCNMFNIPVKKNKIHSVHMLFCLYAAIKTSQLYQTSVNGEKKKEMPDGEKNEQADQLVLE